MLAIIIGAAVSLVLTVMFLKPLQRLWDSITTKIKSRKTDGRPDFAKDRIKVQIIKQGFKFYDSIYKQKAENVGDVIYLKKETAEKAIKKGEVKEVE